MDMDKESLASGQIVPGGQHSFWIDTTPETDYPTLQEGIEVDVAVFGGGIVGLTTAMLLKEAGQRVAVLEAGRIARNVTGHTTAKITSLHGLLYSRLLQRFGAERAKLYAEANQAAIDKIEAYVTEKNINCDFKRTPSYVYTELLGNLDLIEDEVAAAQRLGLPVSFTRETSLPFPIAGAVLLESQAQFHPRRYLLKLAEEIDGDGSYIFENTRALDIKRGDPHTIVAENGQLKAKYGVVATHFPFYDTGAFFSRLYPYMSHALGVRIRGDVPEGMYFTEDGEHFAIRNQPTEAGPILIISGRHYKNGQGGDTLKQYEALEIQARERFDVEAIESYWSTEDYDTVDQIPYIGPAPASEHIYMATGFGGWGMSNGTAAAMIVSDGILGRPNRWSTFFRPQRGSELASAGTALVENINVASQYARGLFAMPRSRNIEELAPGEGRKMMIDRKEVAVYKDEDGNLHANSTVCTHLGCVVNWNNAEKTWDCPCHGSRFNYDGQVIHGPAQKPLRKKDIRQ